MNFHENLIKDLIVVTNVLMTFSAYKAFDLFN